MYQFFWNAYKRLEREVLTLSEDIHFSDDQIGVYSSKIGDLLVRTAIEVESLSKVLYFANGGVQPTGRDLYYDTDCLKYLEDKWLLSKKTIFVSSPNFYFVEEENKTIKPLHKAFKRGTSSSKWQQSYQAVKHDRINNLKKGNIGNLLKALGALYILNIYFRDAKFETVADKDASNIDWGLGSDFFSVKVSQESSGVSADKIYVKKADYDECIYIVKHTDKTAQAFITMMQGINKQISDQTLNDLIQSLNSKIKSGEIAMDSESINRLAQTMFKEKNGVAMRHIIEKEKHSIQRAIEKLRFEAVLNYQQF